MSSLEDAINHGMTNGYWYDDMPLGIETFIAEAVRAWATENATLMEYHLDDSGPAPIEKAVTLDKFGDDQ